ncbi:MULTISPECIES: hypothetical protein [Raoultella]|uniref:Uncharacterized protein n=1 Tax=Raoultella scottii TaxID=3040937 RepID=A0ABU8Z2H5_9ENTR|nr:MULTISPECIES: hypothetical protein [Enterobacteriaceae]MVT02700.1 hypothetical protein [Raoultella sp. 10-1]
MSVDFRQNMHKEGATFPGCASQKENIWLTKLSLMPVNEKRKPADIRREELT